ncbi:hypothetical protein Pcinc_007518 [Petrolisthes cinctipes]|uniref:Secreted protein n=1 Tax=Petrolisthes cinctipes TaxID=88211 RepID=A0AAE1G969_PETCI|nr:hypothetical protein Pcinc_007518 [Petrolisthes cinctipes]
MLLFVPQLVLLALLLQPLFQHQLSQPLLLPKLLLLPQMLSPTVSAGAGAVGPVAGVRNTMSTMNTQVTRTTPNISRDSDKN